MRKLLVLLAISIPVLCVWRSLGEIVFDLAFGWIGFLGRVLPEVSVRWDGLAVFAIASAIFAGALHRFLRWLYAAMRTDAGESALPWRVRWTMALVALVLIIFWAGVSMIGVAHQTAWLATSDEPLFDTALANSSGHATWNLKSIGLAIHNYHDVYRSFPATSGAASPAPHHSWVTLALPFLNYTSEIDLTREWDDPANAKHFRSVLPELINPDFRTAPVVDENGFGLNHYAGNSHVLEREGRMTFADVTDGTSNTLLAGEVNQRFVPWGAPSNCRDVRRGINADPNGFGGPPGRRGAMFVLADGSIRVVAENIDPNVLRALSTPGGGERLP